MTFSNAGSARGRWRRAAVAAAVVFVLALGSCSSDDDGGDDAADSTSTTEDPVETSTTVNRPDGPSADLSEELTRRQRCVHRCG